MISLDASCSNSYEHGSYVRHGGCDPTRCRRWVRSVLIGCIIRILMSVPSPLGWMDWIKVMYQRNYALIFDRHGCKRAMTIFGKRITFFLSQSTRTKNKSYDNKHKSSKRWTTHLNKLFPKRLRRDHEVAFAQILFTSCAFTTPSFAYGVSSTMVAVHRTVKQSP